LIKRKIDKYEMELNLGQFLRGGGTLRAGKGDVERPGIRVLLTMMGEVRGCLRPQQRICNGQW
jgi:hypothetical protein